MPVVVVDDSQLNITSGGAMCYEEMGNRLRSKDWEPGRKGLSWWQLSGCPIKMREQAMQRPVDTVFQVEERDDKFNNLEVAMSSVSEGLNHPCDWPKVREGRRR